MAFDKLGATKAWVETWRKNNGVGPNVTPSKDEVPFKWMHPFLNRVKKDKRNDLKIAEVNYGTPSDLDKYFGRVGYPNRGMSDAERLKIMRGSIPHA